MKKRNLIIYWIATGLFSLGMLTSGIQQLLGAKEMTDMIVHLGYPLYLMNILGIWKILGVIVILIPRFKLVKEWAYAGFFFVMTGALISHLACSDFEVKAILGPVFQTVFIILSWYFRSQNRKVSAVNLCKA